MQSSKRHRLLQGRVPTGSQVPPGNLLQHGLLQVPANLLSSIHLLWCGSPPWAAGASLHPRGPPWGAKLLHHGFHHGLQEHLCWGTWNTSSRSFCTDIGVCRAVPLTYFHSVVFVVPLYLHNSFSSFLNITGVSSISDWVSLGQQRVHPGTS